MCLTKDCKYATNQSFSGVKSHESRVFLQGLLSALTLSTDNDWGINTPQALFVRVLSGVQTVH